MIPDVHGACQFRPVAVVDSGLDPTQFESHPTNLGRETVWSGIQRRPISSPARPSEYRRERSGRLKESGCFSQSVHAEGQVGTVVLTYTQQKDVNSEAKCKILKASVAALVQMTIEVGLSFIVEEPNLAKLAGEGALKLAGVEWPKFIAKQLATLARTQTSELLSQQYNRMGLCD